MHSYKKNHKIQIQVYEIQISNNYLKIINISYPFLSKVYLIDEYMKLKLFFRGFLFCNYIYVNENSLFLF